MGEMRRILGEHIRRVGRRPDEGDGEEQEDQHRPSLHLWQPRPYAPPSGRIGALPLPEPLGVNGALAETNSILLMGASSLAHVLKAKNLIASSIFVDLLMLFFAANSVIHQ